jgi:hypothetical protein
MPAPSDLVHETTTSTGTGNLTLANENGKRSFNTAFGTGGTDLFDYFISHRSAAEWERGTGHLSAASTFVRDTVLASSNAGAAVNFSAGTKDVTNDIPAASQVHISLTQTLTNKDISSSTNTYRAASDTATGAIEIAVQSEMEAGTDTTRAVVPGRQHFHPSAAKAVCRFNAAGTIAHNYNITSITDSGVGDWVVNIATDFSAAGVSAGCVSGGYDAATPNEQMFGYDAASAAGSYNIGCFSSTGNRNDPSLNEIHFIAFGDQ